MPSEEFHRKERANLLHKAVKKLSDDEQQLIALRFFLGLSNQEIA
jgi:DNA-directed RNA polymerase specialized sigma subunit